MKADLVLTNGNLYSKTQGSALAIVGERIAWIGHDPSALIGPKTQVVDLKRAFVYPGFIDSHAHIFYAGHTKYHQLNLIGTKDKKSIIHRIIAETEDRAEGEWIVGFGWDEHLWPESNLPTAHDLDPFSEHNPVMLRRIDGHLGWVNSYALRLAGITKETKDPDGGKILRDISGNPTGILVDTAKRLVTGFIPEDTIETTRDVTKRMLEEALSYGITSIHNANSSEQDLEAYRAFAQQNELPVRVYAMVLLPSDIGERVLEEGPKQHGPFLDVRCCKFFIDGAMGSRGAALFEPYSDDPGNSGLVLWDEKELDEKLKQAKAKGFQVAFHAIGDRANSLVLDAYERVGAHNLRWRIEHAQLLKQTDIQRFKELGVIAAVQPIHLPCDMGWFEERVGKARAQSGGYIFRSLLDAGIVLAGGSDVPVADINPFWGMHAAVYRQDISGNPAGGWFAEQRISRQEALSMYTQGAAYSCFREHELGTLEAGFLADIAVLDRDMLRCPTLIDMKVLYTIVNGKIIYVCS